MTYEKLTVQLSRSFWTYEQKDVISDIAAVALADLPINFEYPIANWRKMQG
jgi:hypothetical protein